MAEREKIPKQLRWKIYARDSFSCRYCGAKPPDAILHIDHVKAVVHGGTNEESNLVTACEVCNLSKGANDIPAPAQRGKETVVVPLEHVPMVNAIMGEFPVLAQKLVEFFAERAKEYEEKGYPQGIAMPLLVMTSVSGAAFAYLRLKDSNKTKRDFMAMCATAFDEQKDAS